MTMTMTIIGEDFVSKSARRMLAPLEALLAAHRVALLPGL